MKRLLQIEWIKLSGNKFFWIGLALYAASMALLLAYFGDIRANGSRGEEQAMVGNQNFASFGFYAIPQLWHNATYIATFFKFIPVFILVFFLSNEFQYKTMRQHIIDGMSLKEFFASKMVINLLFALGATAVLFVIIMVLGLVNNSDLGDKSIFDGSIYILYFFIEVLFLFVFSTFITWLVKRSAISIIVLLLYYYAIEPMVGLALPDFISDLLPTRPSRELILQPFTKLLKVEQFVGGGTSEDVIPWKFISLSLVYTVIFTIASYFVLNRKQL